MGIGEEEAILMPWDALPEHIDEPHEWEALWNRILDLQNRIQIRVLSVQREAA